MRKAGSALIIAVSLIAAVGGIAFAIAKLVYFQSSTYSAQENGVIAYYAAESGIEEAFLRYRYNQDSTVPDIYGIGGNGITTNLDFRVYRGNLTAKTTEKGTYYNGTGILPRAGYMGVDKRGTLSSSSQPIYDLRSGSLGTMNYIGTPPTKNVMPYFGQELVPNITKNLFSDGLGSVSYGLNEFSFLKIPKDESLKIALNNYSFNPISGNPGLNLIMKYFEVNDSSDKCDAVAEVTLDIDYGTVNNPNVKEFKEIFSYDSVQCAAELGIDSNKLIPLAVTDATYDTANKTFYYSANGFDTEMAARAGTSFPNGTKAILSIKPLHNDAVIGLVANRCSSINWSNITECHYEVGVPAGPVTRVESTGYFGGVTRNLYANIDRQSGSLYDLFDYVLYSNQ